MVINYIKILRRSTANFIKVLSENRRKNNDFFYKLRITLIKNNKGILRKMISGTAVSHMDTYTKDLYKNIGM